MMLKILGGFNENIDGVIINKDTECVHKTRVTTRKLRAAMPLFKSCFPPKNLKKWLKEIKNVTRLLGAARDLDVQILFVEQYMKNLNAQEKKCVNALLKDHKAQRENLQPSVVKGLEELKAYNIVENIRKFCDRNVSEQLHLHFRTDQLLEKAYWHISLRLDDFLSMQKYVYLEDEKKKLHEMRIFAKKLRYTLETFSPLYRNSLKGEIKNIKAYQDALGELHDCDVWLDYIPKFIAKFVKEKAKSKRIGFEKSEQAFNNFSTYVATREKNTIYNSFVIGKTTMNMGFLKSLENSQGRDNDEQGKN